jgi:hypothetical protein
MSSRLRILAIESLIGSFTRVNEEDSPMKILVRSILYTILQVICLAILLQMFAIGSTAQSGFWRASSLTFWPGVIAFSGIVSNELTNILAPLKSRWRKRVLQDVAAAVIALVGLIAFGGVSWPAPELVVFTDLATSWSFIVLENIYFLGHLIASLIIEPAGRESTIPSTAFINGEDKKTLIRLRQLWITKPFTPFRLSSLLATDDCLVVTIPSLLKVDTQNIAYINIGNVRVKGWRLPICTVYINSIRGDIHVELNKMPHRQARRFARIVLEKVDVAQKRMNSYSIIHQQPELLNRRKEEDSSFLGNSPGVPV